MIPREKNKRISAVWLVCSGKHLFLPGDDDEVSNGYIYFRTQRVNLTKMSSNWPFQVI